VAKSAMAVIEYRDDWNRHGRPEGFGLAGGQPS
jgi:hypothetical protein